MNKSKKHQLSVVLATFNEADNLERCLNSIKSVADEIIIVDGGSTDQTVKIAQSFNAKVINTTNKPIFHINKQMAMDAATGQYVLQLDADEEVDRDLLNFLKRLKQNKQPDAAAWWIKRKNWFLWQWLTKGGQYPDPVIRLYVNGCASLPQKNVHEQMQVDGKVGWAEGHLLHYSNPNLQTYLKKMNAYTSLTATDWYEQNITINPFSFIKLFIWQPLVTFLQIFIRHKGFYDTVAGFLFAALSGLHYPIAYLKLWEKYEKTD